jgi:HEAT repeat protein
MQAARALGELGDARAIPSLLSVVKRYPRDTGLHVMIARSLGMLNPPQRKPVIKVLRTLAASRDTRLAGWAAISLVKLGEQQAAVHPLIAALYLDDEELLQVAIPLAAGLRDQRAVLPLLAILLRNSYGLRPQTATALAALTGENFGTDTEKWRAWWLAKGDEGVEG